MLSIHIAQGRQRPTGIASLKQLSGRCLEIAPFRCADPSRPLPEKDWTKIPSLGDNSLASREALAYKRSNDDVEGSALRCRDGHELDMVTPDVRAPFSCMAVGVSGASRKDVMLGLGRSVWRQKRRLQLSESLGSEWCFPRKVPAFLSPAGTDYCAAPRRACSPGRGPAGTGRRRPMAGASS